MVMKNKGFLSRLASALRLADDNAVQDEELPTITLHREPLGSSGTESYSGYPTEDYLQKMRGTARADVFDEMKRADYNVRMNLSAVKNPIKAANYEVEPGGDSDEEKQDAELMEHMLFHDMDQTWNQFLGEALTLVDHGHSVFEKTHKAVLDHKKFGSYNGIRSFGFRSQRTIERWNLDPANGKLVSIAQYAYGDLQRLVDIPAQHLLVFSLEKEGSNYEGISLLRPCYGAWWRKNIYLKLNAIGIERFAIPTPLVGVPDGQQNSQQYANLINSLDALTGHQKNYLTYPGGWKVELVGNTYDPQKVEVSIDNEDKRMTKAFLANFLELGMNGTGAYALSNDLSDFFLSGLEQLAAVIVEGINQNVIPEMIMLNRGPRMTYPKLKVSGISDKAGKELAEIYKVLAEVRAITPSDADEEHIRKRYGLPKASQIGQRVVQPPAPAFASGDQSGKPGEVLQQPPTLAEKIRLAEKTRKSRHGA